MDENSAKKSTPNGDKLKNATTAMKYVRTKFRTGKKDNTLTLQERRELAKLQRQGRVKMYKDITTQEILRKTAHKVRDTSSGGNDDQNTGAESLEAGLSVTGTAGSRLQSELYSKKRYENKHKHEIAKEEAVKKSGSNPQSKARQRSMMKKEIKEQAFKDSAKEAANQIGDISKRFVDKAEDITGKFAEFISEHPKEVLVVAVVLILILGVCGIFSSCGICLDGVSHVGITTSYTADDEEILAVEHNYREMEEPEAGNRGNTHHYGG